MDPDAPIVVRTSWNLEDWLLTNTWIDRDGNAIARIPKPAVVATLAGSAAMAIASCGGLFLEIFARSVRGDSPEGADLGLTFYAPAFVAMLAAALLWGRSERQRLLRASFNSRPDLAGEATWTFADGRILIRYPAGSTDWDWLAIIRVVHLPEGFLLMQPARIFHWLPHKGFSDSEDIRRLCVLASEKVVRFEERSQPSIVPDGAARK